MSINELFRLLTEQNKEILNDLKTETSGIIKELKTYQEPYKESKGRPEFLTEQYGDPSNGEKVSQLTGSCGQDSESEEEQNREPGTSLPAMDPSMIISLSQPQQQQLQQQQQQLTDAVTEKENQTKAQASEDKNSDNSLATLKSIPAHTLSAGQQHKPYQSYYLRD